MSYICGDDIGGLHDRCYGCGDLQYTVSMRVCFLECFRPVENCEPYEDVACEECPAVPEVPPDTVVVVDTLSTCNLDSFYDDFNHVISDPVLYVFMFSVFAGLLAVKAVVKTIKAAIR
jgi:hypothetical protein